MYMIIIITLCGIMPVALALTYAYFRRNRDAHNIRARKIELIERVSLRWVSWYRRDPPYYFFRSERRLVYDAIRITCGVDLKRRRQVRDWLYNVYIMDDDLYDDAMSAIQTYFELLLGRERDSGDSRTLRAHIEAYQEIHNNKEGK